MAFDLAEHIRRGVGGERDSVVAVETVDRLDQPDAAHLREIVQRLTSVRVALGQTADEADVALDQPLSRADIAALVVAA